MDFHQLAMCIDIVDGDLLWDCKGQILSVSDVSARDYYRFRFLAYSTVSL